MGSQEWDRTSRWNKDNNNLGGIAKQNKTKIRNDESQKGEKDLKMEAVSFLPDLSPQLHPEVTFRKASGFISLTALPPQDSQLFSLYL